MNSNVKTLVTLALIAGVVFGAYKYFNKSYDPIEFQGKKFLHVEEVSPHEYVSSHFFTVEGVPIREAKEFMQITNLSSKVTVAQRDTVDTQIRASMGVKALPGNTSHLFGVLQGVAMHVFLLESTYIIYAVEMVDGGEEVYRERAAPIFAALEWVPADGL